MRLRSPGVISPGRKESCCIVLLSIQSMMRIDVYKRQDNKNAENVKEFLQSYQSSEVAKAAETIFNGGAVPGW